MPDVRIDASVSPAALRAGMLADLGARHIDNRFHYVGERSAAMWQALADSHSPALAEDGLAAYERAARAALALLPDGPVHVIGMACGDGAKERRLLGALASAGRTDITATAMDVSVPLVSAAAAAMGAVPGVGTTDAVAVDITAVRDLSPLVASGTPGTRLVTVFGIISTLGPDVLVPATSLLRPGDVLMASANLLPDRPGAREAIMAQYDNPPTRAWLQAVLDDVGVGAAGPIAFRWSDTPAGTLIVADVTPDATVVAQVDGLEVSMPAGRPIRVLESFRHSTDDLGGLLRGAGLADVHLEASADGEEGVAAARRPGVSASA